MDASPINASLFVTEFIPTGNPGEYAFENAIFNNQADRTGNGAFDVNVGYVLYVPSTDFNTAMPIIGVLHRYKLTEVTVIDAQTISGVMVWDEIGAEGLEIPTNGVGCGLSAVSPNSGYGYAPAAELYPELQVGSTVQSVQNDLWNITDNDTGGGGSNPGGQYKTTIGDSVALSYLINHQLNTMDVTVTVFDLNTGVDVYAGVIRTGPDEVQLDFTYPIETDSHRVIIRS